MALYEAVDERTQSFGLDREVAVPVGTAEASPVGEHKLESHSHLIQSMAYHGLDSPQCENTLRQKPKQHVQED